MPDKNISNFNKLISNRYRIIKKIASGGMADVYLSTDLKLDRLVAIKILSANYASDKIFVARFKREAQILAKLNDPNIVAVHDWGEFDSSYFICMEYIKGQSLREIIDKKGVVNPKIVVNYAIQICSALELAHRNDLIHRDIKPQNILITPEGVVKITDFGIAKSLNTDITKTLNIIGTAHYISPEQAQGRILDCRTDIYSLGIVMYEMLTADVPFRGESSIDISLKHISDTPVKPSKLISSIPIKLEKIVINQGLGVALNDKKFIDKGLEEITAITGQKAVATVSKRDISEESVRIIAVIKRSHLPILEKKKQGSLARKPYHTVEQKG